jgi:hypothetical protein
MGRGPEFRDHSQDVGEEIFGNGDFSHLKSDITAIRGHVFCSFLALAMQMRRS